MDTITITYCVPCGYERRARDAQAELKTQLGIEAKLIPGKGGVFKVAQGDTVLIQRTRDFFPTTLDVVNTVRQTVS